MPCTFTCDLLISILVYDCIPTLNKEILWYKFVAKFHKNIERITGKGEWRTPWPHIL